MVPESASSELPPRPDRATIEADLLVGEMLEGFTAVAGGVPDLERGISTFCSRVNRWLGARRTSVWLHDRRARELILRASSDTAPPASAERLSNDDSHPIARVMRAPRASTS